MILKSFTVFYWVIHIFTNFFMTFGELTKVASPITKGFLSGLKQGPPPPPPTSTPPQKCPLERLYVYLPRYVLKSLNWVFVEVVVFGIV